VLVALTFWQEVWLAAIGSVAVVVGIVGGLLLDAWRTREGDEHQLEGLRHELSNATTVERNKVLRAERIEIYRQLISTAGLALSTAALGTREGESEEWAAVRTEANNRWQSALAASRFLGSDEVNAVARDIEIARKDQLRRTNGRAKEFDFAVAQTRSG